MSDAYLVYITTKDHEEATRLGRSLLEAKLVACVNILSQMQSLYWWEGAIEAAAECVLIAKTRKELVEKVIAQVKAEHSYDCPCVVAWPISEGNPAFLEWNAENTGGKTPA